MLHRIDNSRYALEEAVYNRHYNATDQGACYLLFVAADGGTSWRFVSFDRVSSGDMLRSEYLEEFSRAEDFILNRFTVNSSDGTSIGYRDICVQRRCDNVYAMRHIAVGFFRLFLYLFVTERRAKKTQRRDNKYNTRPSLHNNR